MVDLSTSGETIPPHFDGSARHDDNYFFLQEGVHCGSLLIDHESAQWRRISRNSQPRLPTRQRLLQLSEYCLSGEPFLAPSDQRLAFGHQGIIDAGLTSQGNRYRVLFGVFQVI